jgi:hypothetical protein
MENLPHYGRKARATAETLGWDRVIDTVEKCLFDVIQQRATATGPQYLAPTPQ